MEEMGYQNTQAVHELAKKGRLAYRRGENLGIYTLADLLLTYMAGQTYDWDSEHNRPPEKIRKLEAPCRYYKLGWRSFADAYAMVMLTPEQTMSEDAEKIMHRRELNAKKQVSDAFLWLQERGVIKKLEPASLGKNAGFLLLIGDDEENRAVERWARQCLGLPMIW